MWEKSSDDMHDFKVWVVKSFPPHAICFNLAFMLGLSNLRSNLTSSVDGSSDEVVSFSIPRLQSSSHQVSICFIFVFDGRLGTWLWCEFIMSEMSPRLWVQGWTSARLGSAVKMVVRSAILHKSLCFDVKPWWHGQLVLVLRKSIQILILIPSNAMLSFFFVSVMCKQHFILTFRWKVFDSEMQ